MYKGAVRADEHLVARHHGRDRVGHRAIGGEIVPAAEQVVIDAGQRWPVGVYLLLKT